MKLLAKMWSVIKGMAPPTGTGDTLTHSGEPEMQAPVGIQPPRLVSCLMPDVV